MDTYRTDDIIFALATGWVRSALAVIRLSGKGCIARFAPAFSRPRRLLEAKSGTLVYGEVKGIDQAVVSLWRDGHGYTGEEALELSIHGSPVGITRILQLMKDLGFRQAEKGEFTYRAFVHGKMDLTQAEAVEELVDSMSPRSQSMALKRLDGALKSRLEAMRTSFIEVMADIEVQLDYSEDEIESFAFPRKKLEGIRDDAGALADTYRVGRIYGQGAKVVLAGRTNVGKSSLFNLLVHENRAIVSPEEGTTRDWIEEQVVVDSIPVRLYDTAGLREQTGLVEGEGIRRTKELLKDADLVVYLHEDGDELPPPDGKTLFVWAKNDLKAHEGLSVSTKDASGIDELLKAIAAKLRGGMAHDDADLVVQSERQHDLLVRLLRGIDRALELEAEGLPLDIISAVLEEALSALGQITGAVGTDDILDAIFSHFCVGK